MHMHDAWIFYCDVACASASSESRCNVVHVLGCVQGMGGHVGVAAASGVRTVPRAAAARYAGPGRRTAGAPPVAVLARTF